MAFERDTVAESAFERALPDEDFYVWDGGQITPSRFLLEESWVFADGVESTLGTYEISGLVTVASVTNQWRITPSIELEFQSVEPEWIFESSDEDVATVDSTGLVTRVIDGTVTITVTEALYEVKKSFFLTMKTENRNEYEVSRYISGSAGRHMEDTFESRLSSIEASSDTMNIYSTVPSNSDYVDWNDVGPERGRSNRLYTKNKGGVDEFVRNTSCWAYGVDMTCVSPGWKSSGGSTFKRRQTATLISPYHWRSCNHADYWPDLGSTVYFVGNDNALYSAVTIAAQQVPDSDVVIGLLDAPINASIKPIGHISTEDMFSKFSQEIKFEPSIPVNFYYNQASRISHLPMLATTQHELAVTAFGGPNRWVFTEDTFYMAGVNPQNAWFKKLFDFNCYIYGGDSGNPLAWIIQNELVAASQFYYATSGPAAFFESVYPPGQISSILTREKTVMDALSTANSLPLQNHRFIDLSSFPDVDQPFDYPGRPTYNV